MNILEDSRHRIGLLRSNLSTGRDICILQKNQPAEGGAVSSPCEWKRVGEEPNHILCLTRKKFTLYLVQKNRTLTDRAMENGV
jgi:hypothetical protein